MMAEIKELKEKVNRNN